MSGMSISIRNGVIASVVTVAVFIFLCAAISCFVFYNLRKKKIDKRNREDFEEAKRKFAMRYEKEDEADRKKEIQRKAEAKEKREIEAKEKREHIKAMEAKEEEEQRIEREKAETQKRIELEKKREELCEKYGDEASALCVLRAKENNKGEKSKFELQMGDGSFQNITRESIKKSVEGGSKRCTILPNGYAFFWPKRGRNISFDCALKMTEHWNMVIEYEKYHSDSFIDAGLRAQSMTKFFVRVDGVDLFPVMYMRSFNGLLEDGVQVREAKTPDLSTGHSMIFGTPKNLGSEEYIKPIMQGLLADFEKVLLNNLFYDSIDSCNVVIEDTKDTVPHDKSIKGMVSERKQIIRMFFFDFGSPNVRNRVPYKKIRRVLLDSSGNVDRKSVEDEVKASFVCAYEKLCSAVLREEVEHIFEIVKQEYKHSASLKYKECYEEYFKDLDKYGDGKMEGNDKGLDEYDDDKMEKNDKGLEEYDDDKSAMEENDRELYSPYAARLSTIFTIIERVVKSMKDELCKESCDRICTKIQEMDAVDRLSAFQRPQDVVVCELSSEAMKYNDVNSNKL